MRSTIVTFLMVIACCGYAANSAPTSQPDAQLNWPRQFQDGGKTYQLYQPQVDSWVDNRLEARAAVSITPTGGKDAAMFGVVWITARTDVDKTMRLVTLNEITVTKVAFPEAKASEPEYLASLNRALPDAASDIPLDHLEANLAITQASSKANTVAVKNDPPQIIFCTQPAVLILLDGAPALRQVPNSDVMRVVNTRSLILLDAASKQYYLSLMNGWVTSKAAMGPWTAASGTPAGFEAIKESLVKDGAVDAMVPNNPAAAPKAVTIYTSSSPAELVQSQGEPEYTPIDGTNLLYMKNTESAVFMVLGTKTYYMLVSGRWFNASALTGPWAYVAGKDLPGDFAKIPADSAKANVRVSVPGTQEAKEAMIANAIPQTATVKISETKLTVDYDGTPKFSKIDGADGLDYATNTALPVILVDSDKTYWSVQNGVWFQAYSPTGPWAVTRTVPSIIYTIPVSSPIHYVTYVRIYGATDDVVYVGYTPGYMGTCISPDGVVVYGTGYYYPAYVGTVWVGYPPTYGYGAGFACGAATGFAFGFAAGAIIGDCWSHPYWGPCRGVGSIDINTHSVYTNWRGGVTSVNRHYDYDAWTGKSVNQARGASFNPYTGRASAGGYTNYLDRADGDFQAHGGGATYNKNTGVVKGRGFNADGNIYDGDADVNKGGFRYNTKTNTGTAVKDGDFYAGHDGNVYRHTDDGWQQHSSDGWQDASKPSGNFAQQRQDLDQQRSSREVGQQRFQNFKSSGGGMRGGGGGGFHRR